ncbi:hypothetical protein GOP47_0009464 [Adiantum capillus-veneris]|uniref:Uncharacterized protein n=1 Tax=Adiantum capillus-veneris TaxID=13818 RepID=A0A9D4UWL9_ADICA|nr:hypothetical protein GOP47_0009464 [Adiantum capillus-veneris]
MASVSNAEHSVMSAGAANARAAETEDAVKSTNMAIANQALMPGASSMALIPTSTTSATVKAASVNSPSSTTAPAPVQPTDIPEAEEAWPFVTRALMVAVMGSQAPGTAAITLLTVFRPLVDGWAAARKESKRWKERAEAYLAEHHKHKTEVAHQHDTLYAQTQALKRSLAESEAQLREIESHHSTLRSSASSLEKKLAEAEAATLAAKQAHALEAQERKKQEEAMRKSAQEAKAAYEKLSQEADRKAKAQDLAISSLRDKVKENEAAKAKLEEQLGSTTAKNASLEEALAQKNQEVTTLQNRVTELNARNQALERLYQRIPTRRYL